MIPSTVLGFTGGTGVGVGVRYGVGVRGDVGIIVGVTIESDGVGDS